MSIIDFSLQPRNKTMKKLLLSLAVITMIAPLDLLSHEVIEGPNGGEFTPPHSTTPPALPDEGPNGGPVAEPDPDPEPGPAGPGPNE